MIFTHTAALSVTFLLYGLLASAFYGWGRIGTRLLGLGKPKGHTSTLLIWMGWAYTLFVFQVSHFLVALRAPVVIIVLAVGAAHTTWRLVKATRGEIKRPSRRNLLKILVIIVAVLAIAIYIASRAMLPPTSYDSGLFHLNKIRWINSFAIFPGLGNLHGRLAFNQSFFVFAAALNFYPFFGHGRSTVLDDEA